MSDIASIIVSDLSKSYHQYLNTWSRIKQVARANKQYYIDNWILQGISFEIYRGRPTAIIGKNGSGKSTLLQLICGTLNPTTGSVVCNGRIAAMLELGSGFNPDLTGIENIEINAALMGFSKSQTKTKMDDILAFADIGEHVFHPVKTYSSGMVVRLAFAVMANVDADILIVDEALSVGDAIFTQKCTRFIRNFSETKTLLFVSHDMNAVASLCEQAIWLESGKMKGFDVTGNIVSKYTRSCYEQILISDSNSIPNSDRTDFELQEANKTIPHIDIEQCWNIEQDYGNKRACIEKLRLTDLDLKEIYAPSQGDMVILHIHAYYFEASTSVMAGYILKDMTGQVLWGQNSTPLGKISAAKGEHLIFEFLFRLPGLPGSEYVISPALSEGEPDKPVVTHYKQDALVISPISTRNQIFGLIGAIDGNVALKRTGLL